VTAAMTDDLHCLELLELATRIKAGELSPVTVARALLDRIASLDGALESYALVLEDVALAQAGGSGYCSSPVSRATAWSTNRGDVRFPDVTQAIADWVSNCAVEAAGAHKGPTRPRHRAVFRDRLAADPGASVRAATPRHDPDARRAA
jgi:hypothetical protein